MMGSIPQVDRDVTVHDYIPGQPVPTLIRDPNTGRIVVNEMKRYIKPYTLVTEPDVITLAGNALSDPIPMTIDNKGHFEVFHGFFFSSESAGFTVTIFDPDQRPILMNREVHVATIAAGGGVTTNFEVLAATSSAGRAFRWPETFWMGLGDRRAIFATFRNLSANENTIRFALHGLRWYHQQAPQNVSDRMQQIYRERRMASFPFFYTTERNVALTGLGSQTPEVRFTDEAWVEVLKLMRVSTANFNTRIVELTTNKRLMETAIRDDLVFGNGEFPFLAWESSLFEPNYKLAFELTNLSEATNTIWITLGCRKILWDPKEDRLARP